MPTSILRILLLVGVEFGYGRDVIRGVASYVRDHRLPWVFRRLDASVPSVRMAARWQPHGAVTHLQRPQIERAMRKLAVPTVDISARFDVPGIGHVRVDDRSIGRTAALHFLDRGFRHFAFVGYPAGVLFSDARRQGFVGAIGEKARTCHHYHYTIDAPGGKRWRYEVNRLRAWLAHLPRPTAVMAVNDRTGSELAEMCGGLGLRIPEDIALIVVNNDDLLCQIADPPLSSVLSPMDRVGYEAARMLNRMLAGTPAPAKPLLLEPAGVVTRRSSDVIAVDDPVAATALSFIRRRACDGIKVEDVLDHLHISRSLLEQKLRKAIGRTPLAEIRRVRVERAKQLLAETDLHMTAIARASGFASDVRLSSVFRQLTGTTPTAYRAESAVAMRSPRTGPIDQP